MKFIKLYDFLSSITMFPKNYMTVKSQIVIIFVASIPVTGPPRSCA